MFPGLKDLCTMLAEDDRFLRTAARLLLQGDPKQWIDRLAEEPDDRIACEAIVALCRPARLTHTLRVIFDRLARPLPRRAPAARPPAHTLQLSLFPRPEAAAKLDIAAACDTIFPHNHS